jgi:WD40 repeat protein
MTTSLALCLQESTNNIVLGCGMENGSALFYDLGALGRGRDPWWIEPGKEAVNDHNIDPRFMCSTSLGNDPILCMDLVSSRSADMCPEIMEDNSHYSSKTKAASLVAVGGCAGDANALSELPENEQGTVSTIKVKLADDSATDSANASIMRASVRSKTRTCSIDSGGKVGVSICQFRPDGRIFAVGGWDHRLRLFSRTSSKPLAILRGHDESVTAIDWASNAALSGLLATGAGDGRICLWRVFPHSLKSHESDALSRISIDDTTILPPNIR